MDLLGLLLPQRCAACAHPGKPICSSCLERLPRLRGPLCERCGAPTAWPVKRCRECSGRRLAFVSARAAVGYDRRAAALVSAWKEHGIRALAPIAAELLSDVVPAPAADALTFVPADGERRLKRGHHPAERLAVELARRWRLPLRQPPTRTRSLRRQRGLTREARRRNVAGAFRSSGDRMPSRVVLVDDVYTTGATASAAASALRAGGAQEVTVVTFARTVRASS